MTGQQLKNSILQMAIQGKLVPQDPRDEPASILLERIREEKKRLVKDKILKKSYLLSNPLLENDIPYDIPDSWVWIRLGDIGEWGAGATPAKGNPEFYSNGTIPWLKTGELNNGVVYKAETYITEKAFEKCSLRKCKEGDVLIAMYGATIGKLAIAGIPLTTNQACCACTPFIIYNKYLFYYLMACKKVFIEQGEGGAQPNISREKIVAFPFALPPLSEQRRIVEKLESLMPLIESYGKSQEALNTLNASLPEKLRQSILQEAIQGHLVPQDPNEEPASVLLERIRAEKARLVKEGKLKKKDLEEKPISPDEIPFDIPEGWVWCRLSDICSFLSRGKSPNYLDTDKRYPVFAQKCNLKDGGISLDQARFLDPSTLKKWPEEYKLKTGDVLVNSTGTGTVGRTRLFNEDCLGTYPFVVPDSHVSVVRSFDSIHSEYLYYLMNTKWIQTYFEDNLAGSTNQKELYIDVLGKTPVPLPPLSEQRRIVTKLEKLLREIDKLKG